ncbi:DUF7344 domain-containing protein [Halogeometricum borinquense]|uniref:Predicted DNA binding protein n=2 Tax=Halogeometricum borinquense (strain ATCC 700274 / DSM 11551 / JCM 10706 / KCTC 4070 / PR3) TaxID=469382 RepID=E4NVR8_HALBP|nr:predicted DNA binding protein [Halogeometricum borinquense DSM 11551]
MSNDFDTVTSRSELHAHPYRRRLLICLDRHITLSVADIADELAVWARACPLSEIPAEDVKDIYMELYHTHLPKLKRANVIVYDQERDLVSLPGYGADAVADLRIVDEQDTDGSDDTVRS